jgi:hypothetical protein
MPFDGVYDPRKQYLLEKLEAVSVLLASEDVWCQQRLRDRNGRRCLLGALIDARARTILYRPVLKAAIAETGRDYTRIESFNDDPATTFATIRAVLDSVQGQILTGQVPDGPLQRIACSLHERISQRRAVEPITL